MSEREQIYQLLDAVPEAKISYVVAYLQGLTEGEEITPNAETLEAFAEVDEMKKKGNGQHFSGSTEDFFNMLLEE